MIYPAQQQFRDLSPAEMRRANGGDNFVLLALAVADVVNSINNIDIDPNPGCGHP